MLACFDPSAHDRGPEALLFRSDILGRYLADRNLELCWAVGGEKQIIGNSVEQHGRLRFQGGYVYRNGEAVGTHNATYFPTPTGR